MTTVDLLLVGVAAVAAGAINAVAGGGSLVSFPTLVAVGLLEIDASITNTVALCPGYLGATLTQRRDLVGQGRRATLLLPVAVIGGVAGAYLLLHTGQGAFRMVVPFLLLFAAILVGAQDAIRAWLFGRERSARSEPLAMLPVAVAAVYGGYFGAGMGVIILAALGIVLHDGLLRVNALKQSVSLFVNVSAAVVFVFSDRIHWPATAAMMVGSLAGGALGGRFASKIPAHVLRWMVVVLGVALAIVYFLRALGHL